MCVGFILNNAKITVNFINTNRFLIKITRFLFFLITAFADNIRIKRQDDDEADQTTEELCENRPADEYFRLSTDGDCRDVVRFVKNIHFR